MVHRIGRAMMQSAQNIPARRVVADVAKQMKNVGTNTFKTIGENVAQDTFNTQVIGKKETPLSKTVEYTKTKGLNQINHVGAEIKEMANKPTVSSFHSGELFHFD